MHSRLIAPTQARALQDDEKPEILKSYVEHAGYRTAIRFRAGVRPKHLVRLPANVRLLSRERQWRFAPQQFG